MSTRESVTIQEFADFVEQQIKLADENFDALDQRLRVLESDRAAKMLAIELDLAGVRGMAERLKAEPVAPAPGAQEPIEPIKYDFSPKTVAEVIDRIKERRGLHYSNEWFCDDGYILAHVAALTVALNERTAERDQAHEIIGHRNNEIADRNLSLASRLDEMNSLREQLAALKQPVAMRGLVSDAERVKFLQDDRAKLTARIKRQRVALRQMNKALVHASRVVQLQAGSAVIAGHKWQELHAEKARLWDENIRLKREAQAPAKEPTADELELREIRGLCDWGAINAGRATALSEVRRFIRLLGESQWRVNLLRVGVEAAIDECEKWAINHKDKPDMLEYWLRRQRFFRSVLDKQKQDDKQAPAPGDAMVPRSVALLGMMTAYDRGREDYKEGGEDVRTVHDWFEDTLDAAIIKRARAEAAKGEACDARR